MTFILFYLVITMLVMNTDAIACCVKDKDYDIVGSFFCSLVWPVTVPFTIYCIYKKRKV